MKLPNGDRAIVDMAKLTDYCLSRSHLQGRHKAYLFERVLGLDVEQAGDLQQALLAAAREEEAELAHRDRYGQRYQVDFQVSQGSRTATVRSAWIVRTGEDFPRFVSCYVVERKRR